MIFTRLDSLYIILPVLLVFAFLKWRRRKSYLTLSMLPYLRNRIRPVSRFVYLPRVLELFALLVLAIRAIFGRLRQAKDFEMLFVQELWIETKKKTLRVSLDGEVVRITPPLHYRIRPKALKVIAPL